MARLNIGYDLLTYEGDILRLKFWAHAFEILKAQGAVFLQTEGKLAGCWVMSIDEGQAREEARPSGEDKDEAREKVIVRSNGVVTYVGKDIANQFWKFGLLGRDFRYRLFVTQADGRPLWATTSGDTDPAAPPFGHARHIYNVIDSRQMYLQALLNQALRDARPPRRSRTLDPLLLRDGRALPRDRAGARLRDRAEGEAAKSRSSRCPAEKGSASRSTICSIC